MEKLGKEGMASLGAEGETAEGVNMAAGAAEVAAGA